jgi:hypothetical protein
MRSTRPTGRAVTLRDTLSCRAGPRRDRIWNHTGKGGLAPPAARPPAAAAAAPAPPARRLPAAPARSPLSVLRSSPPAPRGPPTEGRSGGGGSEGEGGERGSWNSGMRRGRAPPARMSPPEGRAWRTTACALDGDGGRSNT